MKLSPGLVWALGAILGWIAVVAAIGILYLLAMGAAALWALAYGA